MLCVQFFVAPWIVAHQAPLPMEFSRREDWSGLPSPIPGDLPDPGIEPESPVSPALQADSSLLSLQGSPILPTVQANIFLWFSEFNPSASAISSLFGVCYVSNKLAPLRS